LQDIQGHCPRELYGVCPQAQANIVCPGTLGQGIFYLKPQAQATHFMASLAHSGLGSWGVMGLGQNVFKVPRGLDVAISPPPTQ